MYPKYTLNLLNIKVLVPIFLHLLDEIAPLTRGFFMLYFIPMMILNIMYFKSRFLKVGKTNTVIEIKITL